MSLEKSQINEDINRQKQGEQDRYLEFNLGKEKFAVPLLAVREVIAVPETANVPFTPDYYKGIMNLRGEVLSVIDIAKRMDIEASPNPTENAVIIIDLGYTSLGMVVDSINRVITTEQGEFSPPPDIESNQATEFVTGCYISGSDFILFLDIDKILDRDDRELIQKTDTHQAV